MSFASFVTGLVEGEHVKDLDEKHPLGHEIDREADKNPHGLEGFVHGLGTWAKEHPATILTVLHKLRPVLTIKNVSVVTSYDAVKDVLGRDSDFAVTYGKKMKMITDGAGFFLGSDDEDVQAFEDRTHMQMLFRRDDFATLVQPMIQTLCRENLSKQGNDFNLVEGYLKQVPALFATQYFGLSDMPTSKLIAMTETLFEYLFIDVVDDPQVAKAAAQAASELRALLDEIIQKTTPNDHTVMGRGVKLHQAGIAGFAPVSLRNNVIGLLIGLVSTTAKSAAMAFDWATQTEKDEQKFYQAYQQRDTQPFQQYVQELTRLNPINPGLFRKAVTDTTLFSGGKKYSIPKGNLVFVGTYTAMRDEHYVSEPDTIVLGRASSVYLTYGYGLHACFGRYINDFHVTQLLESLFDHGHMKRKAGKDGDLVFAGAFPSHLWVECEK